MKFIYADSLDFVDPGYCFKEDRFAPGRRVYWDDRYSHEMLDRPPYDGLLVSKAVVGGHANTGKYTESQAMRFARVGARKFLRLEDPRFQNMSLFGDCGAFSYAQEEVPPYTPEEILNFYEDGGFDYGFSVDHIIFDFDIKISGMGGGNPEAMRRFRLTLDNAQEFYRLGSKIPGFEPIGVAQGWSPGSMAEATRELVAMGYRYIALGGLVPLKVSAIHAVVQACTEALKGRTDVRFHLLGFAKAEFINEFSKYPVASFDSTSPLLRAFKDNKSNYFARDADGALKYYTAIRIPQATENNRLKNKVKAGLICQEDLQRMEEDTLEATRTYASGACELDEAMQPVRTYTEAFMQKGVEATDSELKGIEKMCELYRTTFAARPWEKCRCNICQQAGIEAVIFRASNRNKRRGMHNLFVFKNYVNDICGEK